MITGSSRGIGASCARIFSSNGYNVVINYNKSEKEALELSSELGSNSLCVKADVTDFNQVLEMFEKATSAFGRVDVLVNNAGIAEQKLFTEISETEWDRMFNVNVKGVFNCCRVAVKDMLRRHSGNIINVSSMWGQVGASCEVHYSAAKGAVISFSKALAKELGPSNIRVNCVAPGVIDTDMNGSLDESTISDLKNETPLGVIGKPVDVANLVFFLASDNSRFITGQVVGVNGGFLI